jgi:D-sedoheptulose 7-phosphate isomerase
VKLAIARKVRESHEVGARFFEENAATLEACVVALAERFRTGGRLFVIGNGGSACDAAHVAVEFVHPIVEKRRALPALSLAADTALLTAVGNDGDFASVFERQLAVVGRAGDAVLGISTSGASANVIRGLAQARRQDLLTIGFAGRDGGRMPDVCDYCFVVKAWSIHRVQETHTLLLHLLWDLVHVAMGEDDVL